MKEGLEEFLKRIELKPTNEMLIERFISLVLEEEILERILYLKKLVGLLLTLNPSTALRIAALELQEARKEQVYKEYEIAALIDIESCFFMLEKAEKAQVVREEISKLTLEYSRFNIQKIGNSPNLEVLASAVAANIEESDKTEIDPHAAQQAFDVNQLDFTLQPMKGLARTRDRLIDVTFKGGAEDKPAAADYQDLGSPMPGESRSTPNGAQSLQKNQQFIKQEHVLPNSESDQPKSQPSADPSQMSSESKRAFDFSYDFEDPSRVQGPEFSESSASLSMGGDSDLSSMPFSAKLEELVSSFYKEDPALYDGPLSFAASELDDTRILSEEELSPPKAKYSQDVLKNFDYLSDSELGSISHSVKPFVALEEPVAEYLQAADPIADSVDRRWRIFQERLVSTVGAPSHSKLIHDFLQRVLAADTSSEAYHKACLLVSSSLRLPASVAQRRQISEWIFEELDPKSMQQYWVVLDLQEYAAKFFRDYLDELKERQEFRRILHLIHDLAVPGVSVEWCRTCYDFLPDLWRRLRLKGWYWSEQEGSDVFIERAGRREDPTPSLYLRMKMSS